MELALPFTQTLGELRTLEVYVYYDGPRLFSCQSPAGQVYLAVWLDDNDSEDLWLLAPVSPNRFDQLESQQLDLRTVFVRPENGFTFLLSARRDGRAEAVPLGPETLTEEMLPDAGQYLPTRRRSVRELSTTLMDSAMVAKQVWRHALDLRLQLPSRYGNRAPVRELASLLVPLQDTVDAIVYGSGVDLALRGRLPAAMLGHTELSWQYNYPGSFGILLTATEQADLFGHSTIAPALARLVELIGFGADREKLTYGLREVHQRAAARYARFLGGLVRAGAELNIEWITPEEERHTASMSLSVAKEALAIVNELVPQMPEETTIVGVLVGLNVRLKTFEIAEIPSRTRYSGRIADIAMPAAEHATINDTYTARLERVVDVSPLTGVEVVHWQLVGLLPPSEGPDE